MTSALIHSLLNRLMPLIDLVFSRIFLEKISYPSKILQNVFKPSPMPTHLCTDSQGRADGGVGALRFSPIVSNLQESWSKVSQAARELAIAFMVPFSH